MCPGIHGEITSEQTAAEVQPSRLLFGLSCLRPSPFQLYLSTHMFLNKHKAGKIVQKINALFSIV